MSRHRNIGIAGQASARNQKIELSVLLSAFLLMLCVCFAPVTASAATVAGPVQSLTDVHSRYSVSGVLNPDKTWRAGIVRTPGSGLGKGKLWLKWALPTSKGRPFELVLSTQGTPVSVWILDENRRVIHHESRSALAPSNKGSASGVPISLENRAAHTLVVSMPANEPFWVTPTLGTPFEQRAAAQHQRTYYAMFVGIALAFLTINILTSIAMLDRRFALLASLIAVFSLTIANQTGLTFYSLWPNKPNWDTYAAVILPSLSAAMLTWFAASSVTSHGRVQTLVRGVYTVARIGGFVLAATTSMWALNLSLYASWSLLILLLLFTLSITMVRVWRSERGAFASMVGYGFLLAGSGFMAAQGAGYWPMSSDYTPVIFLGCGMSMLLLSVATVERLYSEDKLRRLTQASLIDSTRAAASQLERSVKARTFELEAVNERLARANQMDGLTGVFNRRYFDEAFASAVETARKSKSQVAVLMIDLDEFKRLNDQHGHAAGDACLTQAASVVAEVVPKSEGFVARYGGEEFVVVLFDTNETRALLLADAIRQSLEQTRIAHNGKTMLITASVGLYCGNPNQGDGSSRILKVADDALYAAKRGGRNRVEVGLSKRQTIDSAALETASVPN